jgi:hypothetical protein
MSDSPKITEEIIKALTELLYGMRYGTITIIVQDGKIIQMDKTEKHRL